MAWHPLRDPDLRGEMQLRTTLAHMIDTIVWEQFLSVRGYHVDFNLSYKAKLQGIAVQEQVTRVSCLIKLLLLSIIEHYGAL